MEQLCPVKNKIAIIGAGPAGIYCALNILKNFKEHNFNDFFLYIFDKSQVLRTILKTGNGRCNITNGIDDIKEFSSNYPRGEKFIYPLLIKHSNKDTLDFFNSIGIKTFKQSDNRIFPISQSAKDVKDKMLNALNKYKNFKIINKEIKSKNDLSGFDYTVISCGSRGTKELIQTFGHNCIPFKKSLCGLIIKDFELYKSLKGVSVKSLDGDFIFTDYGISGPLVFKISSLNVNNSFPYKITINLFEVLDIIDEIKNNPKKSIGNIISKFLPKSFTKVLVKDFDKKASEVSKKDIISYSKLNLTVLNSAPQGEIVYAGGVDLDEIDKNCRSKICNNLWFCGEILNIDGFCGGFNLQNCWSGAYCVALDIVNTIIK